MSALASSAVRSVAPQKIVVRIDEIDVTNRVCHARDKTNVLIQVSFRDAPGGILQIPAQGERWTVTRIGQGPWYLDKKLDSHDDHEFVKDTMTAGDTRLGGVGTTHIETGKMKMNGRGFGSTVFDDHYSASAWTTVTLASDPVSTHSIQVFLNGLLIAPNGYQVNGRVITFNSAMSTGNLVIFYQVWAYAYDDATTVVGRAIISGVDLYP